MYVLTKAYVLQSGYTPLHWAVVMGSTEAIDTLVTAGASMDIMDKVSLIV